MTTSAVLREPESDGLARSAPPRLALAQRFLEMALRCDYLSNGRGHRQSRRILEDRRRRLVPQQKLRTKAGASADAEQAYLLDLARRERLTSSEEYLMAKRMRAGDVQAQHALIEANLGLVVMFARRYQRPGIALLDLIAEGNIGLMHATKRFDPDLGYRFSTYAKWSIRQAMQLALPGLIGVVRLPARHVLRRSESLPSEGDTPEAISERDVSACDVETAEVGGWPEIERQPRLGVLSVGLDEGPEALTIPEEQEPPQLTQSMQLRQQLSLALAELSDRERAIVSERFALVEDRATTLDELARRYGVSIERIRQIEAGGLRKLERVLRNAGQTAQSLL